MSTEDTKSPVPGRKRRGGRTAALPSNEVASQPERTGRLLQAAIRVHVEASEITKDELLTDPELIEELAEGV